MAIVSRLLKITGLFCRISTVLQGSFAKETCNFKGPTNRSHPIAACQRQVGIQRSAYSSVRQCVAVSFCVLRCVAVCVSCIVIACECILKCAMMYSYAQRDSFGGTTSVLLLLVLAIHLFRVHK